MINPLRIAQVSGESSLPGNFYRCHYDWPEDCLMQCGASGAVFEKSLSEILTTPHLMQEAFAVLGGQKESTLNYYQTAYFEAFPLEPKTFIRGEGSTIEEAETAAWQKWQAIANCSKLQQHEYEPQGYTNGAGVCKHCGLLALNVIPPVFKCQVCHQPTWAAQDLHGNYYCEKHSSRIPEKLLPLAVQQLRQLNSRCDIILPPLPAPIIDELPELAEV